MTREGVLASGAFWRRLRPMVSRGHAPVVAVLLGVTGVVFAGACAGVRPEEPAAASSPSPAAPRPAAPGDSPTAVAAGSASTSEMDDMLDEADATEAAGDESGRSSASEEGSSPSARPATRPSPAPQVRGVRVTNTEGQGANMRSQPSANSERIKVVRDGVELDLIGPNRQAEGRVWRNVRDDAGAVGWIPSEFLAEVRETGPRPTPTPAPPTIQVTDLTSPVGRGEEATLTILSRPGLRCEVRVFLSGPATAPRRGLEPKVADERGECSWTWTVPPETIVGTWRYRVTVGTGEGAVNREVSFGVTG